MAVERNVDSVAVTLALDDYDYVAMVLNAVNCVDDDYNKIVVVVVAVADGVAVAVVVVVVVVLVVDGIVVAEQSEIEMKRSIRFEKSEIR